MTMSIDGVRIPVVTIEERPLSVEVWVDYCHGSGAHISCTFPAGFGSVSCEDRAKAKAQARAHAKAHKEKILAKYCGLLV